jgi:hypothetical protein
MKSIAFVAPNLYVVRNWVASGLARLCADELQLTPVFLSPFSDELIACPSGRRFRNHHLAEAPPRRVLAWRIQERLHLLRTHLFAQEIDAAGVQMLKIARRRDRYHHAAWLIRRLMPRHSVLRRRARRVLVQGTRRRDVAALLQQLAPACVIVGSPGFHPLDWAVSAEAARQGIATHCVVNSWDNLTTRGPLRGEPDTLMVWNDTMGAIAEAVHGYPRARVHAVGALQFVSYAAPVTRAETDQLYQRLQQPVGAPYLLYVSGQQFAEYEAEDLALLTKALAASRYATLPLVVRLHPQAPLPPFRALAGARVTFDHAPRFADAGLSGGRFGLSDIRHMAALLAHARVVIGNAGATTAVLEAAIFDRPIIHLRWMDHAHACDPAQVALVRDALKLRHLALLDRAGCRHFCDHPSGLEAVLDQALAAEDAFRPRRQAAVQHVVRLPLDAAPQRIVEVLRSSLPARVMPERVALRRAG